MLRDARYILKGGFILRSVYGSAASTLLRVSDVNISPAIFLILLYLCKRNKQLETIYNSIKKGNVTYKLYSINFVMSACTKQRNVW